MPKPFVYKTGDKLRLHGTILDGKDQGGLVLQLGTGTVNITAEQLTGADARPDSLREPTAEEADRERLDDEAEAREQAERDRLADERREALRIENEQADQRRREREQQQAGGGSPGGSPGPEAPGASGTSEKK